MITSVAHIGLTVSDLDRSVGFYRDVIGLTYLGEMRMSGEATSRLFGREGTEARVAYLSTGDRVRSSPPIELIEFRCGAERKETDLFRTSISEVCFVSDDVNRDYERLSRQGVEFISGPQDFDSTEYGFGRSRAVYLKDPDGIIIELIQTLE